MKHLISIAILTIALNSFGQIISITGKVIYENGNPAAGVIAFLRDLQMSDTTGSDGVYHLLMGGSSVESFGRKAESSFYSKGMLHFTVPVTQEVSVNIYDLTGKLITRLFESNLDKGKYSINPHFDLKYQANSILIARLKIGDRSSNHRFFNFQLNSFSPLIKRQDRNSSELLKTSKSAGIDELQLSLDGEVLTTFEVNSYIGVMPDFIIYNLPYVPSSPSPPNNAGNLEADITLSWRGGDPNGDVVSYDVFLDTENPPVLKIAKVTNVTSVRVTSLNSTTSYYWKIVASDGENTTSGPVWNFSTKSNLPYVPSSPNPPNNAEGLETEVILSWTGGDPNGDVVSYDVFLDTENPPKEKIAQVINVTTVRVANLSDPMTYYWKIVASDGENTTSGPVWRFSTINQPPNMPSNPNPANGAWNSTTDVTLSWTGGDPDKDDVVTYDVLLGNQNPPSIKVATTTSTSHQISGLEPGVNYYWRVLASDGQATVFGPVWSFVTSTDSIPIFTDARDGQTYKKVTIGTQTWMAENLNYIPAVGNSWCYENNPSHCDTYGRLYDWNTARTVCPGGWHLPSEAEWTVLENAVGGTSIAGRKLKAVSFNGSDDYGFTALPAGEADPDGSFGELGSDTDFWAATEIDAMYAWHYELGAYRDDVFSDGDEKDRGYSVRCLQD
jgi:uncharacterized protein (TIGR02145 family)